MGSSFFRVTLDVVWDIHRWIRHIHRRRGAGDFTHDGLGGVRRVLAIVEGGAHAAGGLDFEAAELDVDMLGGVDRGVGDLQRQRAAGGTAATVRAATAGRCQYHGKQYKGSEWLQVMRGVHFLYLTI